MKKIFLFLCFLLVFNILKAQPICNGILGQPIVNVTFGQGNATQSAYSPFSAYAPGLTTNTNLQSSGSLGAANTSGLVKNGSTFGSAPLWLATADHTGNSFGLFMGINMPDNIGDTVVEYMMTGLCPNTTLEYSIWLVNLMAPTHPLVVGGSPSIQYPNIIMRIVDLSNNIIGTYNTGNVPTDGLWHQYNYLFTNGNNTTVKLQLINNTAGSNIGNDVALDDITVRPCVPDANILPKLDTLFCQTTSVNFTGNITANVYNTPNYQWQYSTNQGNTWNNSGPASPNNSYNFNFSTANAPTEYWIRYLASPVGVASSANCHAISDTSKIKIDTIGHTHLPPDTSMCASDSINLDFSGANASTYLWNTGALTSNVNIINSGSYWVSATSLYGCKTSDSINITIIPTPAPNLGNDTFFCEGIHYNIDVSNVNASNYLWNTGTTASNISIDTTGLYWVSTSFPNGCSTYDSVHIIFHPFPVINIGEDTTICEDSQIILNAFAPDINSYLWNNGSVGSSIIVNSSGQYWVEVQSLFGCPDKDSITIEVTQTTIPNLGNDTSFCEGMQYNLDVSNINANSYLWSTGVSGSNIQINTSGLYWVEAVFDNCMTSDSIQIDFSNYPVVDLGADTIICEGTSIILSTPEIYENADYLWGNDDIATKTLKVEKSGEYYLTITNPPYCIGSDSIEIKTSKCSCDLMVPNAFSPNGDGMNDFFLPRLISEGCPLTHFKMYIYNRWGQTVFLSFNPLKGWNGKINNNNADIGTYMYYISFEDWISGQVKSYKGDLTLVR